MPNRLGPGSVFSRAHAMEVLNQSGSLWSRAVQADRNGDEDSFRKFVWDSMAADRYLAAYLAQFGKDCDSYDYRLS